MYCMILLCLYIILFLKFYVSRNRQKIRYKSYILLVCNASRLMPEDALFRLVNVTTFLYEKTYVSMCLGLYRIFLETLIKLKNLPCLYIYIAHFLKFKLN